MTISARKHVALVAALIASAIANSAHADSGRPSEPAAQVVVVDTCPPTARDEPQGSYYTYLRVVDGMSRESAFAAARHVDHPNLERSRAIAGVTAPTGVSAAPGASAALR